MPQSITELTTLSPSPDSHILYHHKIDNKDLFSLKSKVNTSSHFTFKRLEEISINTVVFQTAEDLINAFNVEFNINEIDSIGNYIKSNESLSLAQRKGDVLYGILDQYTGEEITLSKVTGTPVVDGVIYFQLGTEYFRRNYNEMNPRWFGAKGDNINNDSPAFQAAINSLWNERKGPAYPNGLGGILRIESGYYKFNTGLTTYSNIKIEGSGNLNTILYAHLTGANDYFLTMDGGASTNSLAIWRDFTVVSMLATGNGFLLINCAFAHYENIYSENFNIHWRAINCLSSQFTAIRARFGPIGAVGFWANKGANSNPNAITFTSCVFSSLHGLAIRLDDPSNFNMYGGSIEAAGNVSSSAVTIYNGGSQGGAAWNFNGVYFEGNTGLADIQVVINGSTWESTGVIQSCSFNRINVDGFTTNNVLLQQVAPTDGYVTVDMRSNAFIFGGTYIPSASRKCIAVQSASKFRIVQDGNFYASPLEIPETFTSGVAYGPSINVDSKVYPTVGKINIIPTDGLDFTINAPINAIVGQELTFTILNNRGSLGNLTWDGTVTGYRLNSPWIQPLNNSISSITFIYTNYGLWVEKCRSLTNPITGIGTTGNISKFSGPNALSDSILSDTGSAIAIYTPTTPYLTITNGTVFLNSGVDTATDTNFINSSKGIRFLTDNLYTPLQLIGEDLLLGYRPETSASTFDILTRDIATGFVEKKESSFFQKALVGYTVATLPAGTQGDTAYVTDATTPTYLGALTGGGTIKCPVFYNGTAWVSH